MRDMNDKDAWKSLWDAIDQQRVDHGMSLSEMYEETRTSETTYRNMRVDGKPITSANKLRSVELGLEWMKGSIDSVLAGGEPTPMFVDQRPPSLSQYEERVSALEAQVAELHQFLRQAFEQFAK